MGDAAYGRLAHAAVIRATFAEGQEYLLTAWDLAQRPTQGETEGHCSAVSADSVSAPPKRSIDQWKGFLHAANDLFKSMTGGPASVMHFALEPAAPTVTVGAANCLDPCAEAPVPPGLQRTAVFMDFPTVLLVFAFGGFLPIDDAISRGRHVFELLERRLGGHSFAQCTPGPGARSSAAAAAAASDPHECTGTCCTAAPAAAVSSSGEGDRLRSRCGPACRYAGPVWDRSAAEDTALRDALAAAFDAAAAGMWQTHDTTGVSGSDNTEAAVQAASGLGDIAVSGVSLEGQAASGATAAAPPLTAAAAAATAGHAGAAAPAPSASSSDDIDSVTIF